MRRFLDHTGLAAIRAAAKPQSSWWTDSARFYDLAKERAPIMRHSEFHFQGLSIDSAVGWVENRGDGTGKRK